MKMNYLVIVLFLLGFNPVSAQITDYYVSPGIQLAYNFGSGVALSTEVSVGGVTQFLGPPYSIHYSISLGVQKLPDDTGILRYANLNAGVLAFGVSFGQSLYKVGDHLTAQSSGESN